jgi:hypothetical protein
MATNIRMNEFKRSCRLPGLFVKGMSCLSSSDSTRRLFHPRSLVAAESIYQSNLGPVVRPEIFACIAVVVVLLSSQCSPSFSLFLFVPLRDWQIQ